MNDCYEHFCGRPPSIDFNVDIYSFLGLNTAQASSFSLFDPKDRDDLTNHS